MTEAEQAQARRDSEIYSIEDAPAESGGTDWSVIAELREDMRQDDIDSRDGRLGKRLQPHRTAILKKH